MRRWPFFLIETSLLFICKFILISMRAASLTSEKHNLIPRVLSFPSSRVRERDRPWKTVVICLPDSGRHVTSIFQGLSLSLSRSRGWEGEDPGNKIEKRVSIKTRSPPASLSFQGQATKQATFKIINGLLNKHHKNLMSPHTLTQLQYSMWWKSSWGVLLTYTLQEDKNSGLNPNPKNNPHTNTNPMCYKQV